MKKRMIQMLVIFLAMCLTTASKENSMISASKCRMLMCTQEAAGEPEEETQPTILSPINLFMINVQ